jgi:hypothetical protein
MTASLLIQAFFRQCLKRAVIILQLDDSQDIVAENVHHPTKLGDACTLEVVLVQAL